MSSPEFYRSFKFWPVIDPSLCVSCMDCIRTCGLGVIARKNGDFVIAQNTCRNCRSCVNACRAGAIVIEAALDDSRAGHLMKDSVDAS